MALTDDECYAQLPNAIMNEELLPPGELVNLIEERIEYEHATYI